MKPRGFSAKDTQDFLRFMEKLDRERRNPKPRLLVETEDDNQLIEDMELSQMPDDLMIAASLDDQMDQFFMDAEKDANSEGERDEDGDQTGDEEPHMGEALGSYSDAMYLFEEDPLPTPAGADDEEDPGEVPEEPVEKELPPFDVNVFARQVARLLDNYDNLLDIPSVIVNRAIQYLLKNYDEATVDELKQVLDANFNIDLTMQGQRHQEPEPHYAAGALGGGSGEGSIGGDIGGSGAGGGGAGI